MNADTKPILVLASNNLGKIREIQAKLTDYQIVPQSAFGVTEIAETGSTFVENAILKARHATVCSGYPAIADDSGLLVNALKGAPGIYSARYAAETATDQQNIEQLLRALTAVAADQRQAQFVCVLVLMTHAQDPLPLIAQGLWHGRILFEPAGDCGFGYDPVFAANGYDCSVAQLPLEVKNQFSHRALALIQLQQLLSLQR